MAELARISADRLQSLIDAAHDSGPDPLDDVRRDLRRRVALRTSFDAESVVDTSDGRRSGFDDFLLDDCERVVTRSGLRWSLRKEVRGQVLAELDAAGGLADLAAMADPDDVAAQMAAMYIAGVAPALHDQSAEQLQGTALAAEWLRATSIPMPAVDEARAQHTIEGMLQPLRGLVENGFVGRVEELAMLERHAEVGSSLTDGPSASEPSVGEIADLAAAPPLVVFGVGGVGKSTLIARFVLDHVDGGGSDRFPFAYLSFDRPELRVEQPLTLLAEAAIQLGVVFPHVGDRATLLAESARAVVAGAMASLSDRRETKGSWQASHDRTEADEHVLVGRLAALVDDAAGGRELPNVWVLDTFEIAQREAASSIGRMWRFLERLQHASPRLRVIVCGRVPIEGQPAVNVELGALDDASALELLHLQLPDLGLPEQFYRAVVAAVSTHPLSLRLAVLYIRGEAARAGLDSDRRRRDVLFQLQANDVRGVMYRRILDHVDDPDVRRIAHPGLVVRRITADVIAEVLAEPCGLGEVSSERAAELYGELRREVALVRPDGDDGVVQRAELRRLMLPMIEKEDPGVVKALRQSALEYHEGRSTFASTVEELYYRLALGQPTTTLDEAFDADAARELEEVLDELPPSSQVYLANKLDRTVDPDTLAAADDLSWARQAVLSAHHLLDDGEPAEALSVLDARRNDTVTPFTAALKVEALAALRRYPDALEAARTAMDWATAHSNPDTYSAVALLAARVLEDTGRFHEALATLADAETAAATAGDAITQVATGTAIVRIHRRSGTATSPEAVTRRDLLIEQAEALNARDRARNPALVRALAAEIGDAVPSVARDALRLGGFTKVSPPEASTDAEPGATTPSSGADPEPVPEPEPASTSREIGWAIDNAADGFDTDIGADVRKRFQDESDERAF